MARKPGRPTDYTPKLANRICERLAEGVSLTEICAAKGMPARTTVIGWQAQHNDFSTLYARARDAYADAIFDEAMAIADDASGDFTTKIKGGKEIRVVDHENIQRSRLRVDTRLKVAAKLNPAKYGEKLDLKTSGEENFSRLTDAQLNAQTAALLAELGITGEALAPFLITPLPGDDDATRH